MSFSGKSAIHNAMPSSLPGLDVAQGLDRIGGDIAIYLSVLRILRNDFSQSANHIRAAIDNGQELKAKEVAHMLKGVAGNLSANEVYWVATKIDDALRLGTLDDAKTQLAQLDYRLEELFQSIESLESIYGSDVARRGDQILAYDATKLAAMLDTLFVHLEDNDLESDSCLKKIKAMLMPDDWMPEIDKLSACIDNYDFEAAKQYASQIYARLKQH